MGDDNENQSENLENEEVIQNNDEQSDIENNIQENITDNIEDDDEVNITDSLETEIQAPGFIKEESDESGDNTEDKKENKKILNHELISTKVKDCTEDLEEILDHCVMKKNGLDMYYEKLTHWNNAIQTKRTTRRHGCLKSSDSELSERKETRFFHRRLCLLRRFYL